MGIISLEGIEFFAYHGYYDEEQKIGAKYSIDISVEADFDQAARKDELAFTVNYENLYRIIKEEVKIPSKLLENIARRILDRVFNEFPVIERVEISISKFNPPVGGVCNRARIFLKEEKKGL
jgi:7,8-dihydroneopterin aldolase/epimerase/oxygenase